MENLQHWAVLVCFDKLWQNVTLIFRVFRLWIPRLKNEPKYWQTIFVVFNIKSEAHFLNKAKETNRKWIIRSSARFQTIRIKVKLSKLVFKRKEEFIFVIFNFSSFIYVGNNSWSALCEYILSFYVSILKRRVFRQKDSVNRNIFMKKSFVCKSFCCWNDFCLNFFFMHFPFNKMDYNEIIMQHNATILVNDI